MSTETLHTPFDAMGKTRERLRATFRSGKTKSIEFRKTQLLQLAYMIQDNMDRIYDALRKDLGRPPIETTLFDASAVIAEALYAYKNIDSWVKPQKAPFHFTWFPFSPKLYKEAKGTVLIIGAYNYPLWSLAPLSGAIAAGCAVVLKPSEMTPAIAQLVAELFPKYLDQDVYRIVNGGVEESTHLLSLQWDHILYTGSARVGRIVATAAAKYLTPVTLELGGKCPAIIDKDADLELAARRILWGKMSNAGQVCIAPDHVFVHESVEEKFVNAIKDQWTKFYGTDARNSDSYSRLCATSHFERIAALLEETNGEIILGGQTDKATKYIAPTVVRNVALTDSLMKEEIFGPVLPLVSVRDMNVALDHINSRDHPLAIYAFSKDSKFRSYVREHTLSGMFMENDVVLIGGSSVTPFAGVGGSGYGSHKGKHSFDTFTHIRGSYNSPKWIDLVLGWRFPPYTVKNLKKAAAATMPPIPYARPGDKETFDWRRWVGIAFVLALIAGNKDRVASLVAK